MQLNREGIFRGICKTYKLAENEKTGSLGFQQTWGLIWEWRDGQWVDVAQEALEAEGAFWLIGKRDEQTGEQKINEGAVQNCMDVFGWDGDFVALEGNDWSGVQANLVCKADTYKNTTRYKAAFINPPDDEPRGGNLSNVANARLDELNERWGSRLRALRGDRQPLRSPEPPTAASQPQQWGLAGLPTTLPVPDVEDIPF